jgi:UDP-N-acetylglucosamine acyltransferase
MAAHSTAIHPTAIVHPTAHIHETAEIGPFCIVGAEVEIGAHTRLMANLYLEGPTTIGEDNIFFPYSTVGVASQDKKYKGERAYTRIGSRNTIREFVTIHRGTEGGGLLTEIGDGNLLMAYTHVAHDVKIGSGAVLDNAVTLAGHVTVGDNATLSAFSGVHQFCRVGRESFIGGYSVVTQDVMPFSSVVSEREIRVFGANRVGLERRNFSREAIEGLQTAFRFLTRAGLNTSQAIERIQTEVAQGPEIDELLAFIASSARGVIKG